MKKILTICSVVCAFFAAQSTLLAQANDNICVPATGPITITDPAQPTVCSDGSNAIIFPAAVGSLPDAEYVVEVNGVLVDINTDGSIDPPPPTGDQVCVTAFTYDLAAINGLLNAANGLCLPNGGLDCDGLFMLPGLGQTIADLVVGANDGIPGLNNLQEALELAGSFGTPVASVADAIVALDGVNAAVGGVPFPGFGPICYATSATVCYNIIDCNSANCSLMAPPCNACVAPDVSSTIDLTTGAPIQASNGGTATYDPATTSGTVAIPANTPDLFAAIGVGDLCIPDPVNDICLIADIDVISGAYPFTLEFRIENGTGAPGSGGAALTFNATIDGPGACSIGGNLSDGIPVNGFTFDPANTAVVIAIESFSGAFTENVEVNINSISLSVCAPDEVVFGCTDATADNFDPAATCDDSSCTFSGPCTLTSGACNACAACEVATNIDFTTGEVFNDAGEFSGGTPAVPPTYDPATNTGTFILPAGSDEIFTVGGVRNLALPDDVTDICFTADINVVSGTPPIAIEFRIENAANGGEQIGWNATVDGDGVCSIGGSLADGAPIGGWPGFTNGALYTVVFAVVYFGADPPLANQVEIEISNWSLSVCSPSDVAASAISTTDPTTICIDGVGDPIDVSVDTDGGGTSAWVITDAAGIILDLPAAPPFDLDGAGAGQCLIWLVNFDDPAFAPAVGDDAAAAVAASSCAFLSNPITVDRIEITAPAISTTDPTTICADDGISDPINVTIDDAGTGGTTTAWVITDAAGIILDLPAGPPFDLEGAGGGTCLIWLVSTNDATFAPAVGDDALAAVAAATCATLSNSISVIRQIDCGNIICNDLSYTAPTQACSGEDVLLTAPAACDFTGTPGTSPLDPGAIGTYPIFLTDLSANPVPNPVDFSAGLDVASFLAANPANQGAFISPSPCDDFVFTPSNTDCAPLYLHISVVILDGDSATGLFLDGCVATYTIEILPQPTAPILETLDCQIVLAGTCPSDIITITGANGTGTSGATATYDLLPSAPNDTLTISVSNGVCTTDFFFVPEEVLAPVLTCPATASCGVAETLSADLVPEDFGFLEVLITEVDPALGGDTYLDEFFMDVNGVTVIPAGFFPGGGTGPTTQSVVVGPLPIGAVIVDIFDAFGDGLSFPAESIVTVTDQGSGAVIVTAQGNYGPGPVSGSGTVTSTFSTTGVWTGMGVSDNSDGTASFNMGMNGTFTATYTYTDLVGCVFTETCDITVSDCMTACEEEITYTVSAPGCDMTGAFIELLDAAGANVGTVALGTDGGAGTFGIQPCGDYSIVITGAPACYTDAGGDVGPRMFTADGTGVTLENFSVAPQDVPTVGEWGLIILGLLMSITAVVGIRQRRREEIYS